MFPSYEQIEQEAFFRWQRRGSVHGHDREDWLAAEQDLLLALNYEVAAFYPLRGDARASVGAQGRRVCRFCERSAPAARFSAARPALPAFLGDTSLLTYEECDECHADFARGIDVDLERFVAQARAGAERSPRMTIAALKGLAKVALSVMPAEEIGSFEDTIEWVGNPDHDFDVRLFGEPGCDLHLLPATLPHPWVALARRVDDEAPMPYMLVFVGTPDLVVQGPVPLCARDDDLDGETTIVPRACPRPVERPVPPRSSPASRLRSGQNGVGRGAGTHA